MRQKERIDYLYFCEGRGGRRNIRFCKKEIAGIAVLQITVNLTEKRFQKAETCEQPDNRSMKRIKRELRKYDIKGVTVGADKKMAQILGLERLFFQARKQEFLEHINDILKSLRPDIPQKRRATFLMVLDSGEWKEQEILTIFLAAKDDYEELELICENNGNITEYVRQTLYEEWGIVLNIQQKKATAGGHKDFILFLQKDMAGIRTYEFGAAYAVFDRERETLIRVETEGNKQVGHGDLYEGMAYERDKKELPYQMAVNIACQNPIFYGEFRISDIAIYRLEC